MRMVLFVGMWDEFFGNKIMGLIVMWCCNGIVKVDDGCVYFNVFMWI